MSSFNYVWPSAKPKRRQRGSQTKSRRKIARTIRKHLPKNLFQLRIAGDVRQAIVAIQLATCHFSMCVCVCGENNKHNGHILYFRQCAPRAQQETAGNCQQGCGIKHKTISQQLVANIFGIECEQYRDREGERRSGVGAISIGCQMLLLPLEYWPRHDNDAL